MIRIVHFNFREQIGQCTCTGEVLLILPNSKCDQVKNAREFTCYGARSRMMFPKSIVFERGKSSVYPPRRKVFGVPTLPAARGVLSQKTGQVHTNAFTKP